MANFNLFNFIISLFILFIIFYCVSNVLLFYGIGQEIYGMYLSYFVFLWMSSIILPTEYPSV
jgi:hypothetical protein